MDTTRTDQRELAKFCGLLPHLARSEPVAGWSALLDDVTARLRAGADPARTVLDFWRTVNELRDVRGPAVLVGQDATPPPRGGYRCPRDRCDRVERRAPGGPLPECAVFDEPLRFGR
ncbi:hypothetical protein [Saccharothrix sp. HUAS TT1]|uniref:hypothetical protein n=1 Tax=unclassified Saccharothrix TaxID=2593673 RepID=UPI00345B79E5